jgi:hypothetical protein
MNTISSPPDFDSLHLPIIDDIYSYPIDIQFSIYNYFKRMGEKEKKAYIIAKNHLGTSFDLIKSNGFIHWKKTNS